MTQALDFPISISLSKGKISLLVIGAVAFVAMSIWLYGISGDSVWPKSLYVKLVAVVGAIFFGICGIYGFRKLFDSRPGLVIDSQGLFDNSSGVSAGRVPWSEISGFKVTTVHKQKFLTIEVCDPEKYLQRTSGLKRQLVALNMKHYGSPIQIASNTLAIRFDDLVKTITDARARYHGA